MSSVLDRVRKLLALATSPNVHEAAAAAARAQALITEHRLEGWLEDSDEVDPIVDARDDPLEVAKRPRRWKAVLASALAELNGCVAYTLDRGRETAIVLVGRERDRAAVEALWSWLPKRIEWLSATHGEGRSRKWHEAFRIGAVSTIVERLRDAARSEQDALDEAALVVVEPAMRAHQLALERFVSERLRLGRGRSVRVIAEAWEEGRAAAAEIELPED